MRPFLLSLAVLLTVSSVAQRIGLRAGYRTGYAFMDQLNAILIDYNQRPEVVGDMPELHLIHGPAGTVGIQFGDMAFNAGFMIGNGRTSGMFRDSLGNTEQQQLLMKSSAIRLEFAQFPEPGATFAVSFAFSAEYAPVRLMLHRPSEPNRLLDSYNLLSVSPNVQLYFGLAENIYFWLNPYYQFYAIRPDFNRVYNLMVPNPGLDPSAELLGRFDNAGVIAGLMFSLGE